MGRPSHNAQATSWPAGASGKQRLANINLLERGGQKEKRMYRQYYRLYTRTSGDVVNWVKHKQYKFLAKEALPMFEIFGKGLRSSIVTNVGSRFAAAVAGGFAGQAASNSFRRSDQITNYSEGVSQNLRYWEEKLIEMFRLRRSLGYELERYFTKELKDKADRLSRAEEGFNQHLKVLNEWAKTMDRVDQTIDGIDQLKTIKDYHDRAVTVVNFFRQPVNTIVDEMKDKLKSGYRNTLTGDKDEWDVIKAGVRNMGNYYATLDWAPRGYQSPKDIVNKLDSSGSAMEEWGRLVRQLALRLDQSRELQKSGNIPLAYVDIK